ncbi:hypothetical protein Baya_3462 [Bagarius yarrelli]|uniref:Uncharacterized protein n=1 Tax=Bagarius yarrelli TaxID=175774 RepID=A0A556TPC9_BAGYA|nr:hypothetical protein Baya_3462 [Bagarius yarrelli]
MSTKPKAEITKQQRWDAIKHSEQAVHSSAVPHVWNHVLKKPIQELWLLLGFFPFSCCSSNIFTHSDVSFLPEALPTLWLLEKLALQCREALPIKGLLPNQGLCTMWGVCPAGGFTHGRASVQPEAFSQLRASSTMELLPSKRL